MGRSTFSYAAYSETADQYFRDQKAHGSTTYRAQQEVRRTGKLNPLVDPGATEYGLIRRSLPRFEQRSDGLYELTVGIPMPLEDWLDTTGSMGDNVDKAFRVLPALYDLCSGALPGYDLHVALGIFGDYEDKFILCRPQYEMLAEKIVDQLGLMNPEHGGAGNGGEDPQYALFGSAYLTASYANRIGLKRYSYLTSDEPARPYLSEQQLIRVYGESVFEETARNGFDISRKDLPTTKEVVQDLLDQAHAFFLEVKPPRYDAHGFWTEMFGAERVVVLPRIELLPQVQAVIIGLTEGTIGLDQVGDFLIEQKVSAQEIKQITRAVANIPIGAQVALREGIRVPQKGDLFREKPDVFKKTNLWPIDPNEVPDAAVSAPQPATEHGPHWL